MTATFAGQFVMSGFLRLDIAPWKRVAITRAAALGPAVAVALSTAENAGLQNRINEYLNILQSVQLPFAMLPLLHLTNQKRWMGDFANGGKLAYVAFAAAALVLVINVVLVVQFVVGHFDSPPAYAASVLLGWREALRSGPRRPSRSFKNPCIFPPVNVVHKGRVARVFYGVLPPEGERRLPVVVVVDVLPSLHPSSK